MADYNIYIHSNSGSGGNGTSSQTTPFANRPAGEGDSIFEAATQGIHQTEQFATSGFNGLARTGVAMLSKAAPQVALAVAVIGITNKVLTLGSSYVETYTGFYEFATEYNNFKTVVSNILNPVGVFLKEAHRSYQFRLQNEKIEQTRTLVGNSTLTTTVKGV